MPTLRERTDEIRGRLANVAREAEVDKGLTSVGKAKKIAGAYLTAKQQMAELRTKYTADQQADITALRTKLFGAPSTTLEGRASYRDALARAEMCRKPEELEQLLGRAELIGDEDLARACAVIAAEHNWRAVINEYAASRPVAAEDIARLIEAQDRTKGSRERIGRSMEFHVPRPAALGRFSDFELERLAAGKEPR